jgi:Fe-S-cluster containining protein
MRVGRNDPCPCGSGKKYKRCCGSDLGDRAEIRRVLFNREIAYLGALGHNREAFCIEYMEHKRKLLEQIRMDQLQNASRFGKTLACQKGCCSCCDEPIGGSLQESEVIVYFLYQHEEALHLYLKNYQKWLLEVSKHQEILEPMVQNQNRLFEGDGNLRETLVSIGELGRAYWKLHIPCPFLVEQVCTIYEVRPWVCAGVYSTSCCDLSNEERNTERVFLHLPATIELPFYDERMTVEYLGPVPMTVYNLLNGGFKFLSQMPGLASCFDEFKHDKEVLAFARKRPGYR